jgi:anti-sigma B factor antagonist
LSITTRVESGVAILDVSGRITIGSGDVALRDAFLKVLEDGHKKILINVKGVTFIDSAGLGELVRCRATAASRGADVRLLHVEEKIRKVLLLTHLIGVFEIFDHEPAAVQSFT